MVEKVEALLLTMSADIKQMERAYKRAQEKTNETTTAIEKRFERMNGRILRTQDQLGSDLRRSFAAIGVGLAIKEVTQYADSWTAAQNKVAAAGVAQRDLGARMSEVADIARETRSSFGAVADLYSKVTRVSDQLGLSQRDVARLTENVAKSFVAGGSAASEQAAGILQLSQALGSGVLQGEELKSIRENAPLLAKAIADSVGSSVADLKELGAQGKLTSDVVARAIINATSIQADFARTNATVAQSLTNLRTSFTQYIGGADQATGVTRTLSGFIELVANNFDTFADAAVVAASVLGGALAAGAIVKLVAGLRTMATEVRTATTAVGALRTSFAFLTGPWGAAILAIGSALAVMGLEAAKSKPQLERIEESMSKLEQVTGQVKADTDALTEAQNRLTRAMEAQGTAAQDTARLEISAIQRRLEANQKLARSLRSTLQAQLQTALAAEGGRGGITEQRLILSQNLQSRGMNEEQLRSYIDDQLSRGPLKSSDEYLLNLLRSIDEGVAKVNELRTRLIELDTVIEKTGDGGTISGSAGASGGGSPLSGYATDAERLTAALRALREARDADSDAVSRAANARDRFLLADSDDPAGFKDDTAGVREYERLNAELATALDKSAANVQARSREAVQALLQYAQGADDLAEALKRVPSLSDILTPADAALLNSELKKMVDDATNSVLVGEDRIIADLQSRLEDIDRARSAALAAGETDVRRFLAAIEKAFRDADAAIADLYDAERPSADIDRLADVSDTPTFEDSPELKRLRDGIGEAVKDGFRQGLQDDNWGEALRSMLANAMTSALDETLNGVAGFLTNVLTGAMGSSGDMSYWDHFWSAAGGYVGGWLFGGSGGSHYSSSASAFDANSTYGGGRAAGGPVSAGSHYRVNESGTGEFLFMGRNPGQVLTAAQINGLSAGSGRGGVSNISVHAGLTVNGGIDAVSWPMVQRAMAEQERRIPSLIDRQVFEGKRNRKPGYR